MINDNHKQETPAKAEPLFNIPKVTGAMISLLLIIHLIRVFILDETQDTYLLFAYSFIPQRLSHMDMTSAKDIAWNVMTMFTYMGFHIGWMHFVLNITSLLAFGTAVEKFIGGKRMFGLFVICGLAGILVHYAVYPQSIAPVVGASAAISGLFGAILRIMQYMGRFKPGAKGLFPIVAIWVGMNIVFGMMGMPDDPTVTIAWIAHIGGFVAGLFCLPLFVPARLKELTRTPNFTENKEEDA